MTDRTGLGGKEQRRIQFLQMHHGVRIRKADTTIQAFIDGEHIRDRFETVPNRTVSGTDSAATRWTSVIISKYYVVF